MTMNLLVSIVGISDGQADVQQSMNEKPVLDILECIDVTKINKYLEERRESAADSSQEAKNYIPDFVYLAEVSCRVVEHYLKVHRSVGYYKDNFQMAISTLCKLYAATGNAEKLSRVVAALPNYLPSMSDSEALPRVNGDTGISTFNFEFQSLGYELNKLKLQRLD